MFNIFGWITVSIFVLIGLGVTAYTLPYPTNRSNGMPKLSYLRRTWRLTARLLTIRIELKQKDMSKWLEAVLHNPHITRRELRLIATSLSTDAQMLVCAHSKTNKKILVTVGENASSQAVRDKLLSDPRIPENRRTLWALSWGDMQ